MQNTTIDNQIEFIDLVSKYKIFEEHKDEIQAIKENLLAVRMLQMAEKLSGNFIQINQK